jgi:predicted AlkP superfamily pyrophosphatase or phosphodiesterase|tara:strand:- start:3725 stop:3997 length:273 start_codon:yes stop_codon:yes gene_type:complete
MEKQKTICIEDAQKLAIHILGLDENTEYDEAEESFMENFHTDLDHFADLLSYLVPMIDVGKSPLTDKTFKGFSVNLGGDDRMFIIKTEVK